MLGMNVNKKIEDIQEMSNTDGTYKLVGYQKHGPYPGLPGIGHWSTYVAIMVVDLLVVVVVSYFTMILEVMEPLDVSV